MELDKKQRNILINSVKEISHIQSFLVRGTSGSMWSGQASSNLKLFITCCLQTLCTVCSILSNVCVLISHMQAINSTVIPPGSMRSPATWPVKVSPSPAGEFERIRSLSPFQTLLELSTTLSTVVIISQKD